MLLRVSDLLLGTVRLTHTNWVAKGVRCTLNIDLSFLFKKSVTLRRETPKEFLGKVKVESLVNNQLSYSHTANVRL